MSRIPCIRRPCRAIALGVVLLAVAHAVRAEIFQWTDASGRVHFTHDLNQVPAQHRAAAEAAARNRGGEGGDNVIQTYSAPAKVSETAAPTTPQSYLAPSKRAHRIRVEKAGTSLRVIVRINGRVQAPFLIDTGASDVVVPQWVVDELGLDLRDARTAHYSTANGVIEAKLTTLDRVELGTASAEQVPAAVSDSMRVGLLGLSFFNRFNYNIDTARGIVTLVPNDLEESGLIRGGRSEADWRGEYQNLRRRIQALEARQKSVPSSRSRSHAAMKAEMEELERQLAQLESEADAAHVPFAWRE